MEQHVKIIGAIYIVLGVLAILGGFMVFITFTLGGAALSTGVEGVPQGFGAILAGMGLILSMLGIGFGVFGIIVAVNLRQFREWARIAQIVLSVLGLLSIPFGTVLGIYVLWALLNKETAALFQSDGSAAA